jgi:hypothetical protein
VRRASVETMPQVKRRLTHRRFLVLTAAALTLYSAGPVAARDGIGQPAVPTACTTARPFADSRVESGSLPS